MVRNRKIVDGVDMLVAFWDGMSLGNRYTIGYARKQGGRGEVVEYGGQWTETTTIRSPG